MCRASAAPSLQHCAGYGEYPAGPVCHLGVAYESSVHRIGYAYVDLAMLVLEEDTERRKPMFELDLLCMLLCPLIRLYVPGILPLENEIITGVANLPTAPARDHSQSMSFSVA